MPVWNTHPDYDKFAPRWKEARDAVAGQSAVHQAGKKYLPMLKDQDDDDYNSYKTRAGWFGATITTVEGLKGMLFRRPPRVEVPDGVKEFIKDIDMAGTPLDVMAEHIAEEILTVGGIGLLVDHPPGIDPDGGQITQADKESKGLRPTIQNYPVERVINWRHRRIKNAWGLSMVVLEEEYNSTDPVDPWKQNCETRWRVLDIVDGADVYRQRVFRKNEKDQEEQVGEDIFPLMDGQMLDRIPFFPLGIDSLSITPEPPPLMALIDTNFKHYRVTADYENGCHFCGLPTPWIAGYSPEVAEDGKPVSGAKLYVGSSHAWVFPDPNAKAQYLEFHGTGLNALKDNLDKKEVQMAILGSRMLAQDNRGRSNESATAATVHRTGEASKLGDIANGISLSIERALNLFIQWAGQSGEAVYQVNRDFMPVVMDANTLASLTAAIVAGKISFDTYWDMLQRGDVAAMDVTADEEKARIKNNPEPPAPPPAPLAAPPSKGTQKDPQAKAASGGQL